MRIDAHHHLWQYNESEFGWIDEASAALRRDFLMQDLLPGMRKAGVDATVVVQARTSPEETSWLLHLSAQKAAICGVVGWISLAENSLGSSLERWQGERKLVGFREVTQAEAAGYLDRDDINRGLRVLTSQGYSYDLLLRADQLVEATRFVDRHPRQPFILDHAAKPQIAKGLLEPWRSSIRSLAKRDHVACKLSGMVTEADWKTWTLSALRPYLDVCVEAFGPGRLLAGSDWPVCLLASGYARWWNVLEDYFSTFSTHEQACIFGENARRMYGLTVPTAPVSEAA